MLNSGPEKKETEVSQVQQRVQVPCIGKATKWGEGSSHFQAARDQHEYFIPLAQAIAIKSFRGGRSFDVRPAKRERKGNQRAEKGYSGFKKSLATFQPDRLSIYQFMRDHQGDFSVSRMCRLFEIGRSSFYASAELIGNTDHALREELRKVFWFHKRRYGTRRIVPELRDMGFEIGRAKARRLMQELELKAIQPRSFVPKTTQSLSHFARSTNLLLGRKLLSSINEVWVGDITYLPLEKGQWAYLSVWMDLYSRFIVGWKVADHMRAELVLQSFQMAWVRRNPDQRDLILHSDGASQYAAKEFRESISRLSVLQSMTRKDNHYDNAFIESLFSRLKAELLEGGLFRNVADAQREVFDYIYRKSASLNEHPV